MNAPPNNLSMVALRPLATCLAIALATTLPSLVHADPRLRPAFVGQRLAPSLQRGSMQGHHAPSAKSVPIRPAATTPVGNCDDDGAGSLRAVVGAAIDGDTIDLSALTCSTITLTSGAIMVDVDNLTFAGPTDSALLIDGHYNASVIDHSGTGTLIVEHLTLSHGYAYIEGNRKGGGISSSGNVTLDHATISHNLARYQGAGVGANGIVTINDSTVSDNFTTSSPDNRNLGGGVMAGSSLTVNNSTITNNEAYVGGGVFAFGPITISNSTISGNKTSYIGGGLMTDHAASIHNSTIANNSSGYHGGGIFLGSNGTLDLQSTIVANSYIYNTGNVGDISGHDTTITISGNHNLIMVSELPTPADTITSDPLLHAPADNGGPTPTMALKAGSPAINFGSNPDLLDFDQRGTGFARMSGTAVDIGAVEFDDVIFTDGFDGSTPWRWAPSAPATGAKAASPTRLPLWDGTWATPVVKECVKGGEHSRARETTTPTLVGDDLRQSAGGRSRRKEKDPGIPGPSSSIVRACRPVS